MLVQAVVTVLITVQCVSISLHHSPSFGIDLADFLGPNMTQQFSKQNEHIPQIQLPGTRLHGQAFPITSNSISFIGNDTILSLLPQQYTSNTELVGKSSSILVVFNSTVSLTTITFDLTDGSCATLSSSSFSVRQSTFLHPSTSPILISTDNSMPASNIFIMSLNYHTRSNTFFPLVSLQNSESDLLSENHDISCTGFSLSDTTIASPTGILCDFGDTYPHTAPTSYLQRASTTLLNTQLTNVTSPSSTPDTQRYLPEIDQTIIGCVVKHGTNHFSGTTIRDFNSGGSLLAINSSFAHCTAPLAPSATHPNYILQNYTGTSRISLTSPPETILIQRCSFDDMSTSVSLGGAGLCVHQFTGDVTVKECWFTDCTTTASGGAVVLNSGASPYFPATVEDSIFVHCTAPTNSAGALSSSSPKPLTVVGCIFDMCQAKMGAGAMHYTGREVVLSDSIFLECSSSTGACNIQYANDVLTCTNLSFRRCTCTAEPLSHDIRMNYISADRITDDLIKTCSSTWTSDNVHWIGNSPANTLEIQPISLSSCALQLTSTTTGTSTKLTLTVSSALSGSVEAVVQDGSHSRLVVFTFSGTSATCSASNAQGGEVTAGKTYSVRSASLAGTDILFPRLSAVSVTPSADFKTILISLSGTDFLDSSVDVTLKGENSQMVLTFQKTATNVISLNSTLLPSSSDGLEFGKSYTVLYGKAKGVLHFPDCGQIIEIPVLKQIKTAEITDTQPTYVEVRVTGENIPNSQEITFTVSDSKGNQKDYSVQWYSNGCSLSVTFSPPEDAHFAYSEVCTITAINDSSILLPTGLTFTLPDPPPSATNATCTLSDDRKRAIIIIRGGTFTDIPFDMQVEHGSDADYFSALIMGRSTFVNKTALAFEIEVFPDKTAAEAAGVTPYLLMDKEYRVYDLRAWIPEVNVEVGSSLNFTVPLPPEVTGATFDFVPDMSITGIVTLTGQGLQLSGEYEVTVGSPPVTFSVHTEGTELKSNPLPINWGTASLQSDTTYTLPLTISKKGNNAITIPSSGSFSVGAVTSPTLMILYVDDSSTTSPPLCGKETSPCLTIAEAFSIPTAYGVTSATIKIMTSCSLADLVDITQGKSVSIDRALATDPALNLDGSSDAKLSVEKASLDISHLRVSISKNGESFEFIDSVNSTLTLTSVHITSPSASLVSTNTENVCSWTSSLISLTKSTTTVSGCSFSHISQGVFKVDDGSLTIDSTSFMKNSAGSSSFPSAHRNILCSNGGHVEIDSLSDGDGKMHGSYWISSTECKLLDPDDKDITSPLFVPTLTTDKCNGSLADKIFTLNLVGTMMIPCDLKLEVFENISVTKDVLEEGKGQTFSLTADNTSDWTDTSMTVKVASADIDLDSSKQFFARLVYSDAFHTDAFLFKDTGGDKKAFSLPKLLSWVIPLVVVLIVAVILLIIIVVLLRRRHRKALDKQSADPVIEEMPEAKMEVEDPANTANHVVSSTAGNMNDSGLERSAAKDDMHTMSNMNEAPVVAPVVECVSGMSCTDPFSESKVPKTNTLYNYLHITKTPFKRRQAQQSIARGLAHLAQIKLDAPALVKLSSHWVLFDKDQQVYLRVEVEDLIDLYRSMDSNHARPNQNSFEAQRWFAPEVPVEQDKKQNPEKTEQQAPIDPCKAAVFSLGLVLYEIETGEVPFAEIDAINAHRQMSTGAMPRLERVKNETMRDLIVSCLVLSPKDRPTLESVSSSLDSVDEESSAPHEFESIKQ
ncbi:hypothetical protein BLNAU_15556 [Blattamonas nauphoetae]|uniref:Protein kinase domain-containing protein n=1 Tax=Blattamonas nauphoetae TaxID=2049346 RepID=A0ABQ9XAH5_9EUKA|nr:hypothetical protein BLNAU_15556 [Blattamonas nauphoetae]